MSLMQSLIHPPLINRKPGECPSRLDSGWLGRECVESKGKGDEGKGGQGEDGEGGGSHCVVQGGKGWLWEKVRLGLG